MRERRSLALISVLGLLFLNSPRTSSQERGIGEIVVTGSATLNGQRAVSGSTIYNNQEIETREQSGAVVTLYNKGGSLSVEASSRVRLSRTDTKVVVDLTSGSIAFHPQQISATVNTPNLRIEVEQDGVYRVAVSPKGTEVESMARTAMIKDGLRDVTIHAGETYASWEGQVAQAEEKKKKKRRRIIAALILGPLGLGLALAVSRGEASPPVSPVLPASR